MTTNEKKKLWLERGLQKVEKLGFLTQDTSRTISQAAIQFILSEPSIVSVLPNVYDAENLVELAAAADVAPLTPSEVAQVADLYAHDFYLDPVDPLEKVA